MVRTGRRLVDAQSMIEFMRQKAKEVTAAIGIEYPRASTPPDNLEERREQTLSSVVFHGLGV